VRIFISWSGPTSRLIAEALREWIPYVLPAAEPWMSTTDIDRGARWSIEVSTQLDSANVGIICLTADNRDAPWIVFEAGALSKILSKSLVCTYLFQLRPADIRGPLAQFQATIADAPETRKLLLSMNRVLGSSALPEARLDRMFERWWPELNSTLDSIAKRHKRDATPLLSDRELLEEILTLQRRSDPRALAPELATLVLRHLDPGATGIVSGSAGRLTTGDRKRSERDNSHENSSIFVDTSPLVGDRGEVVDLPYPVFGTVSDLLDELYASVASKVPAHTYGSRWVLRDPKTGRILKEMGRTWAKNILKRGNDDRTLPEAGIEPGMRFEAISLTVQPSAVEKPKG
jgi:hypothetical protein